MTFSGVLRENPTCKGTAESTGLGEFKEQAEGPHGNSAGKGLGEGGRARILQ